MRTCPITFESIPNKLKYSLTGLRLLSPKLSSLKDIPYSAEEQRRTSETHVDKLSIQGVQPKLSARLNIKESCFEIVDNSGRYILKPQIERYAQIPENENVSMHLAALVKIEIPLQGLVYSADGSMTYFIRRFDRQGQKQKLKTEDFAQLSGFTRDTKYNSSMENVAKIIDKFCTFPAIERVKLFRRTIFCFLIGNEDMHLKNFSLIVRNSKIELSPAYDMVNTTIALTNSIEELALPLKGKKKNLTKNDFLTYFAKERLEISDKSRDKVCEEFHEALPLWEAYLERSFLSSEKKKQYLDLIKERTHRLGL
jgi:serine/threonine-protein kinase HipA